MVAKRRGYFVKLYKIATLIVSLLTLMSIIASVHPALLLLCYLVHELGHIITTYLVGGKIKKISMGAFRLAIGYDSYGLTYKQEFLVSISGVLFNLIFSLICLLINKNGNETLSFLTVCNFSLALVNLYPVSILDGGKVLKLTLLGLFSENKAENISNTVSFICVILLWFASVYLQLMFNANISTLLISVFLLIQLCFSI